MRQAKFTESQIVAILKETVAASRLTRYGGALHRNYGPWGANPTQLG